MKTLEVQLPDSLRHELEKMAKSEGISLNQMLITAASNEVTRLETHAFFSGISCKYNPRHFAQALAAVPNVPSVAGDEAQ